MNWHIGVISDLAYYNAARFSFVNGGVEKLTVLSTGNIGIGITTPTSKLDVFKSSATNGNEVIANFMRGPSQTGGSGIVRLGYHNTCDFEINSAWASTGFRFGDYADLNIVNNNTDGTYGAINFATNGSARMSINANGNVLIGKTSQSNLTYKLDVAGKIRANEIVVNTTGADFVFDENYKLRSLAELGDFVTTNKHLPEIPTADQMQKDGVNMGELQINPTCAL